MSNYRRRLLLANQTEEKNLYLYGNSVQEGTPTPDAPIDIISIENPTIKVMGNNLFNNDSSLIEQIFYTSTAGVETSRYGYILNLPNGTYTIKSFSKVPSSDTHMYYIYSALIDKNNVIEKGAGQVVVNNNTSTITFTVEEGQRYFIYDAETSGLSQAKKAFSVFDIQLNAGATALEYEPYYEENITINETTPFGKNLLSPSSTVSTATPFTFDASAKDGSYTINGTGDKTSYSIRNIRGSSFNDMLIDGETYTFAMDVSEQKGINLLVRATKLSDNSNVYYTASKSNKYRSNFTVDKSKYKYQELYLQINPTSEVYENVVVKPILAIGIYSELPFEPYVPPLTTFRGIGDYKDKIYTKDGKVWFEQRFALYEISPDASFAKNRDVENLGLQCYAGAVITDNKYFGVPNTAPMAERESGLSTHFRYSERAYGGWGFTDCVFIRVSRLWLLSDNFTTVKEVIQWIADNKVNIIYPLATPIVTEVTGSLAEQILAIDRTKNIYFISENGVQGETEVIEE